MDVVHAQQRQHSEDEDAGTRAEVAEVKRDECLEDDSTASGELVMLSVLGPLGERKTGAVLEGQGNRDCRL